MHPFLLSKNNHFRYWYNDSPFSFRLNDSDQFWTSHSPVTREPKDWKWECLNCATEIRALYKGDLNILFSGGMDSEVVVRSFFEAGIPIQVFIMRFAHDLNQHDIHYAIKTCDELGIKPHFLDLDLLRFWEDEVWSFSDLVKAASPQLATILWAVDQIDGVVILGAGEGYVRRPEGSNTFYEMESEIAYSLYRWFVKKNKSSVPAFFQFNSEIMLSFLLDTKVLEFVQNGKRRGLLSTNKVKHELYSQHFNLAFRKPLNGFEKVSDLDLRIRQQMLAKYPGANSIFKTNHYLYMKSFGLNLSDRIDKYFVNFESKEI